MTKRAAPSTLDSTPQATHSTTNRATQWLTPSLGAQALTRSWWRHWVYPLLFLLTLMLSLATYLTLDSIQQSVDSYINDNQLALVGGDLILESNQAWPEEIIAQVETLPAEQRVYDYRFNAMLVAGENTLLARIKGVSSAYPLYGEIELASGTPLWTQIAGDGVVVAPEVLTSLGVEVGDTLSIGEGAFRIRDVIVREPDRPLTAFGFGGRVIMSEDALARTELMGQRSRINYEIEMAGSADEIATQREALTPLLATYPDIELSDPQTEETSVSRISDNVLMFLKLLVIAVLLLSAVAMYGVITAFVTKQRANDAIRQAMGETTASIKISYYRLLLVMAIIASLVAGALSMLLLYLSQPYLTAILPSNLGLAIHRLSLIKTLIIALVLTLWITQRALRPLENTKPAALLNQGASQASTRQTKSSKQLSSKQVSPLSPSWQLWQRSSLLRYTLLIIVLYAFLAYEVASWTLAAQILIGLIVFVALFWGMARGWLWLLSRLATTGKLGWMPKLAIHNLSRKGNQSALFFVTLALSVAVLTLVTTINHSINEQFITAYPEDAPNLFLLDVQRDQHQAINTLIDAPVTYYPVIRARVLRAAGVAPSDIDAPDSGDDPTRVFNLSYTDTIMETEYIVDAITDGRLYTPINPATATSTQTNEQTQAAALTAVQPLSILDTAADMLNVTMGDQIVFNVQGIELTGQITSIRARYERGPSPFFYFLFEPSVLAAAPQIQFATAHVDAERIPELQGELVRALPAVTTIDGTMIAEQVQGLVAQMSRLVYVFTLLALLTGLMVLISSLLSTSQDRMTDSASFRLLGMQQADLYQLNMLEIGVLGVSAALFAVILASVGAWLAITQWFNLRYSVPWQSLGLGGVILVALLLAIAIVYVRLVIGRGIMARVRGMV